MHGLKHFFRLFYQTTIRLSPMPGAYYADLRASAQETCSLSFLKAEGLSDPPSGTYC